MAYQATTNIRHDGKRFKKGDTFPTSGVKKEDLERLKSLGAIVDPEAEAKALAAAEAKALAAAEAKAAKEKEEAGTGE